MFSMVEIGSVIHAQVTRVEPYGIFLEHAAGPVSVLLPDVWWSAKGSLRENIRVGDRFDVLVLRYNYRDRIIVGSIKRLHPEENPYRQLSRLEPGTVLSGKVRHGAGSEVTVELENGAWGHVPKRLLPAEPRAGDVLEVTIAGLEVDEGRLWLEPASHPANPTNGSTKAPSAAAKA